MLWIKEFFQHFGNFEVIDAVVIDIGGRVEYSQQKRFRVAFPIETGRPTNETDPPNWHRRDNTSFATSNVQKAVDSRRLVEFGNIRPLMWNHVPGEFMRFWSFFTSSHLVVFFIAMRILLVRSSSCGMKSGQVCSSTDNLSPIKENKRMFFKLFFSEIYKLSSFVLSNSVNFKSIHPFS